MKINLFTARANSRAVSCSGTFQIWELLATVNHGGQIVLNETGFFARHEAREDEDGSADASFAYGYAFVRAGDAEPIAAGFFQGGGNLGTAVAVAIAFHDGENF